MRTKRNLAKFEAQCGAIHLTIHNDIRISAPCIIPTCRIFSSIHHNLKHVLSPQQIYPMWVRLVFRISCLLLHEESCIRNFQISCIYTVNSVAKTNVIILTNLQQFTNKCIILYISTAILYQDIKTSCRFRSLMVTRESVLQVSLCKN